MKKLMILFFISVYGLYSTQIVSPPPVGKGRTAPDTLIPAEFPEGNNVFATLLGSRFIASNIDCSVTGMQKTMIEFVVEKDGSINDIKTYGSNPSLNKEAIRTIKSIVEKWKPATLNGEKVRSKYKQPFKLVCQ